MPWTAQREKAHTIWIQQLVSLSHQYYKSARVARIFSYFSTWMTVLSAVYSVPGYGCGLLSASGCVALQWTGIIISLIAGISTGMSLAYNPSLKVLKYEATYHKLLELTRIISLEIQKPREDREDASEFAEMVVNTYDSIVKDVRLPMFISGERQLANLALLQAHTANESRENSDSATDDTDEDLSRIKLTDADRACRARMEEDLARLDNN